MPGKTHILSPGFLAASSLTVSMSGLSSFTSSSVVVDSRFFMNSVFRGLPARWRVTSCLLTYLRSHIPMNVSSDSDYNFFLTNCITRPSQEYWKNAYSWEGYMTPLVEKFMAGVTGYTTGEKAVDAKLAACHYRLPSVYGSHVQEPLF